MFQKDIEEKTDRELLEELVREKRREERRKAAENILKAVTLAAAVLLILWKFPQILKLFKSRKKEAERLSSLAGRYGDILFRG